MNHIMMKFFYAFILIVFTERVIASEWGSFITVVQIDDFTDEKSVFIGVKQTTSYSPVIFGISCDKDDETIVILGQEYSSTDLVDIKYRFDSLDS